jgi:hypothetical protein
MKADTFVKIGLVLAFVTALLFWQDVWAWIDSKPPMELALDVIGFALKWFYLALLAFLAASVPHYIKPWLKLTRLNGRRRLKAARRGRWHGQPVEARVKMPRMNRNEALVWMMSQMAKSNPSPRPSQTKGAFGEGAKDEIHLRF